MNHLAALFIARILSRPDLAPERRDPRKRAREQEGERIKKKWGKKEREMAQKRDQDGYIHIIHVCRCRERDGGGRGRQRERGGAGGWAGPIRLIPRRRPRPKERNKKE